MVKEFKTNKGSFLAIRLDYKARGFKIMETSEGKPNQLYYIANDKTYITNQRLIVLPDYDVKIVGLVSEITEEQAKNIVDESIDACNCLTGFVNYNTPNRKLHRPFLFQSTLDSFNSLMQANEIYSENPLGKHFHNYVNSMPFKEDLTGYFDIYEKVERNTGNWLLLKKL